MYVLVGILLFWSYLNGEREFPAYCDDVAHAEYGDRKGAVPSVPRRSEFRILMVPFYDLGDSMNALAC